jgi:hypothetical protein
MGNFGWQRSMRILIKNKLAAIPYIHQVFGGYNLAINNGDVEALVIFAEVDVGYVFIGIGGRKHIVTVAYDAEVFCLGLEDIGEL